MKKTLLLIVLITVTISTFGQRQERVKALKVAFITEKLALTPSEAQKFWPVYNAIETEKEGLRKKGHALRRDLSIETLNEKDANSLLQKMLTLEDEKHQLQKKQVSNLLEVIPAKKVILLKVVEDKFNKRMLEEIKKRRQKFKDNKR